VAVKVSTTAEALPADELKAQLEAAFLPWLCRCTITHEDELVVQIRDPASADVLLQVLGRPVSSLRRAGELQRFILQLRQELQERARLDAASPDA
jgi:hypothetical protein